MTMTKDEVQAAYLYKTFIEFAVKTEMYPDAAVLMFDMFNEVEEEALSLADSEFSDKVDAAYLVFVKETIKYISCIAGMVKADDKELKNKLVYIFERESGKKGIRLDD
tara:strand:- start:670 stop:993 length:324 start_codon:yes stop_codon:yes gene_type:complete